MLKIVDSKQMKAIDSYSINTLKIPSLVLMERAAYAVARVICEDLDAMEMHSVASVAGEQRAEAWVKQARQHKCVTAGEQSAEIRVKQARRRKRVIAVCGSGNNGGDGLAVARILYTMGFDAGYMMAGNVEKATQETLCQLEIVRNLQLTEYTEVSDFAGADVLVDAVFGIGLMREVTGHFAGVLEAMDLCKTPVYAVDIPSGVSTDTGQVLGCGVHAVKTVTFGCNKLGLVLYPGAGYAGEVIVSDIGFPEISEEQAGINTFAYEKSDIYGYLPPRCAYSNKGSYGKVLVIAGSKNMGGAGYFCARAAYMTGCGLVRVLTVEENREMMLSKLPEAVLTTYDSEAPDWNGFAGALEWADSVVLGPGLTTQDYALRIVRYVWENCAVPLVMDADGLNLLAAHSYLWELRTKVPALVLTPHLGEMSRLTGLDIGAIAGQLRQVCRDFASSHGVVCALKDARTVISDGERTFINLSGNDGMATGGSGDVLSGIIGGFLASGMEPLKAASFGCFVHGCAGDAARNEKGAYGLLASDIIQYMSKVICDSE